MNKIIVKAVMLLVIMGMAFSCALDVNNSDDSAGLTLAQVMGSKVSEFDSPEKWTAAVKETYEQFKNDKSLRNSVALNEEDSEAVDKFDLVLLSLFGKTLVNGAVVLSDDILKAKAGNQEVTRSYISQEAPPPHYVYQNQGSYKGEFNSFKDNYLVYNQVGGSTQFKMKRTNWTGFTRWWDTDASKLAIKCVYFWNPSDADYGPNLSRYSLAVGQNTDKETNDDYISERSIGAGVSITVNYGDTGWTAMNDSGYPSVGPNVPANYDGVYTFHYIQHSSYTWKKTTSVGLRSLIDWGKYSRSYYIPW